MYVFIIELFFYVNVYLYHITSVSFYMTNKSVSLYRLCIIYSSKTNIIVRGQYIFHGG